MADDPPPAWAEELAAGVRALREGQARVEGLLVRLAGGAGPEAEQASAAACDPGGGAGAQAAGAAAPPKEDDVEADAHEVVVKATRTSTGRSHGRPDTPFADDGFRRRRSEIVREETDLPDWFVDVRLRGFLAESIAERTVQRCSSRRRVTQAAEGVGPAIFRRSASATSLFSAVADLPLTRWSAWWAAMQKSGSMLQPSGPVRLALDVLSVLVVTHDAVTVPLVITFGGGHDIVSLWISCLSVALWTIDMLAQFRTAFWEDGRLERRSAVVARNYLRGFFLFDFVVLVVDIMTLLFDASLASGTDDALVLKICKAARLLRVVKAFRIAKLWAAGTRRSVHIASFVHSIGPLMWETVKFIVVILCLNHFLACAWCFMGRERLFGSDTGVVWLDMQSAGGLLERYDSYGDVYQYTTGLHFSVSQMTSGSVEVLPVNSAERVFMVLSQIWGMVVFSTLVSSVAASASRLQSEMFSQRSTLNKVTMFLTRAKVSADLRSQLCKAMASKLKYEKPLVLADVEECLDKLPLSLRDRLQQELTHPLLEHHYFHFLARWDCPVWEEVCRDCTDFSVHRHTTLFGANAEAAGMYFLVDGGISYTLEAAFAPGGSAAGRTRRVEAGAWLAEAALWCTWRHTGVGEVEAAGTCEVILLQTKKLLERLRDHTLVAELTKAYAQSFHHFLVNAKPPLCDWPTDLSPQFGVDEVIATMPAEVADIMGEVAVQVLLAPSDNARTWLMRAGRAMDELVEEVKRGVSTLHLTTSRERVVRCVRLVAIKLVRDDGRLLVALKVYRNAAGRHEAYCKLPGSKQRVGERPDACFERLLQGPLRPLELGIERLHSYREVEWEHSRRFGVHTRYIRTIIRAHWRKGTMVDIAGILEPLSGEDEGIQATAADSLSEQSTTAPTTSTTTYQQHHDLPAAHHCLSSPRTAPTTSTTAPSPYHDRAHHQHQQSEVSGKAEELYVGPVQSELSVKQDPAADGDQGESPAAKEASADAPHNFARSGRRNSRVSIDFDRLRSDDSESGRRGSSLAGLNIYKFTEDGDEHYTWLTDEQFQFFSSARGKGALFSWMRQHGFELGRDSAAISTPMAEFGDEDLAAGRRNGGICSSLLGCLPGGLHSGSWRSSG